MVQGFHSPVSGSIQVQGWIYPTNYYFYPILVIRLRVSFYTLKNNLLSFFWVVTAENVERAATLLVFFIFSFCFPNLGFFYCKKNPLLLMFSKLVFNRFSWTINGFIHSFIHISISHSIWVWVRTLFFLCGFKKRSGLSLVRTPSVLRKKKVRSRKWRY